jgi:hypothetical protein
VYEVTAKAYSPLSVAFEQPSLSCAHAAQLGIAKAIAAAIIRVESPLCIFAPFLSGWRNGIGRFAEEAGYEPRIKKSKLS